MRAPSVGEGARVRLTIMGGFELRQGREMIVLPPSVERVVAYVALHDGPAARMHVAGALWLDTPDERAMANLRSALWRLRRPGLRVIESCGEHLALEPDVDVDAHQLAITAHHLLDGRPTSDRAPLECLASGGELLGDWYDDWVLVERERFRQLRLQALERLTFAFVSAGQYGRAVEAALAAIATEPLRESSHRALISVHLAQGNQSEAIRQYESYRRIIRNELDLDPSPRMDELMRPLRPGKSNVNEYSPVTLA